MNMVVLSFQIDRWPDTGFVKKLQRRDDTFYYYNRKRECEDREVHKVKVYAYWQLLDPASTYDIFYFEVL